MTATLACTLAALLAAESSRPALRWGADSQGGAPYVFQDPANPSRMTGFEVELADLLAARLGLEATLVQGPYATLLELLARGDFDVVLNGIEVTPAHRRAAALSRPYYATQEVLTVRRDDARAPRTLAALAGRRVGTLPDTEAARIAREAGADVRTYDGGQDDLYRDLKLGRLDAVLMDGPAARYYADLEPGLESLEGGFGEVSYAVAVRREDSERVAAIDGALEGLIADGTLRRLYERWGLWGPTVARLLGDPRPEASSDAPAARAWREAVGRPAPFLTRLTRQYPALLPAFARGAALTLVVSVSAMALAIALGLALALARRHGPSPVQALAVAWIELFRGTPLLVQLTVIYFGLPELGLKLDPLPAGVLALGLNYAAAEAENYRAGLEAVPVGQVEAARVLGLSTAQAVRFVIGPQALRTALPPMTNDFIALLKDSSLVSLVTLTELTKTYTSLASATRDHLGLGLVVAASYLLLGLPFALLARRLEQYVGRHLRPGASP